MSQNHTDEAVEAVAIIGMAARLPGAADVETFWRNLVAGVESIRHFTADELHARGIDRRHLADPRFVSAGALLEDVDRFDASFFGFTPREAQILDPQHRTFFECAWSALEDAGCDPARTSRAIGVFAGTSMNSYLLFNLVPNAEVIDAVGLAQACIASDKDFLATHLSYKLDLRGPSLTIQTACSTSLVAVQLAFQHLLTYQCDVALAGGVSIQVPHQPGYRFEDGGILSPDGHCRVFDAAARGTVKGNGVGVVVLKRLSEALRDGDRVVAVIRGAAVNNDGSVKVGFTAPSADGQAEVIATALAQAGVPAGSLGYIEAHGTGTPLGDPVEVSALTRVFRAATPQIGFCALGAVKSNIGHLDAAAGVAGLIKAALVVERGVIPPTVHFSTPNPELDLPTSPFYVNADACRWPAAGHPRRAGVSSFGIGGTNAHVVLEQAPPREASAAPRAVEILPLSAKSASALTGARQHLAAHLRAHADANLGDIAWTLQNGRAAFAIREAIVAGSTFEAAGMLEAPAEGSGSAAGAVCPPVAFLFPGQGAQYARMGAGLYASNLVFARAFDEVAVRFQRLTGMDVRRVLFGAAGEAADDERLAATGMAQPALFAIEHALARWWMHMGVMPDAMIGHSLGEYVAACIAGVFGLDEAVALVAARARLMESLPQGAMLAVRMSETDVQPWLDDTVALAAVNGPRSCVLSGPPDAIARIERTLGGRGVQVQRLRTSRAFHSTMMDPILAAFRTEVRRIRFQPPSIPFVSNLTGGWITAGQATDPEYWVRHLRQTVRFDAGLRTLFDDREHVSLEIGPGATLSRLAQRARASGATAIAAMREREDSVDDERMLMRGLAKFWTRGGAVDWQALHGGRRRNRLALPTYVFDRQRHWIDPPTETRRVDSDGAESIESWLYVPHWHRAAGPTVSAVPGSETVLVLSDEGDIATSLERELARRGDRVVSVRRGPSFASTGADSYVVGTTGADYQALFAELTRAELLPTRIVHLWCARAGKDRPGLEDAGDAEIQEEQAYGFGSLLCLARAAAGAGRGPLHLVVVSTDLLQVHDRDRPRQPWRATMLGPCFVIPQEDAHMTCRLVDFEDGAPEPEVIDLLLAEVLTAAGPTLVACRGGERWERTFERRPSPVRPASRLERGGVYWITGGTGGIGLALARWLAREYGARLALMQRSPLPPRESWEASLQEHDDSDPMPGVLRALLEVEGLGGEVLVCQGDVTDHDQVRRVAEMIRGHFGRIDGIVHAAGVPGGGLISLKTMDAALAVMAPKVLGTQHLAAAAREHGAKFLVLCSSIAGLQGGFGQVDYAGANAALDAFAACHTTASGLPTFSIDWDAWRETGMAVTANARLRARLDGAEGSGTRPDGLSLSGLRDAEGAEAFQLILEGRHAQVAVSTVDLLSRIVDPGLALASVTSGSAGTNGLPAVPRPSSNDLEQRIAEVWERVLGVAPIGHHDNFFELGGDSLAGVQVIAHMNRELGLQVTVPQFFEAPTVAALATLVLGGDAPRERSLELSRDRGRLRRERRRM
ncbi:MAG: SDR family NAD(P)-dependent oxidoreductase [Acidobacteriota bacterium]